MDKWFIKFYFFLLIFLFFQKLKKKKIKKMKTNYKKKLVLHFDINETILITDPAGEKFKN